MSDPIQEAAATVLEQLRAKVQAVKETPEMQEVLRLHRALNALEGLTQAPSTTLAAVFGLGAEGESMAAGPIIQRLQLTDWEFTGLGPLEAAKKYLKKAGAPRAIGEIVAAINDHGGKAGSVDHLKTSLTRSTLDIVKVNDDMYGLLEHFPHMKRTGKPKKKAGATNGAPVEEEGELPDDEEHVASMLPADMIPPEDDEHAQAAEGSAVPAANEKESEA
jgi:hypothetical protein